MSADCNPFGLQIYFEDNHVLVVEKPAGLLSQGDLSGDLDILTVAKQYIKQRDNKPGNVYMGLVHRLDRPVSGVMILAKTSKAAGRLSSRFRERKTSKIYRAIVEGKVAASTGELKHRLFKERSVRKSRVVGAGETGKDALLRYRVLEKGAQKSLVEVQLVTGLSHQIRAQFAAVGHPIVGDRKYGSSMSFKKGRIALHAYALTVAHPVKKSDISIISPLPQDWPWP